MKAYTPGTRARGEEDALNPAITIRRARPDDARTITEFNLAMARETERKQLDPAVVAAGVAGLLLHPERGFYLLAEYNGAPAGALMITTEWSDWRNGTYWWIQSLYVCPASRRRGVFRRLYEQVQALAEQEGGVRGLRLYVRHDNPAARKTYVSVGMTDTGYRVYEAAT